MNILSQRKNENSSASQSRSSRTLKSRHNNLNPEEQAKKTQQYYFKSDPLRQEIYARAKKQNYKVQPVSRNSPKKDHLSKASKIIQALLKRHQQVRSKIERMKEEAQKQHEAQCPFTPEKKKTERFIIGGDVIRRNEIWLQEKKRREFERKQLALEEDLRMCTFRPAISSRRASQVYLKQRDPLKSPTKKSQRDKPFETTAQTARLNKQYRDISNAEFETAKREICYRLINDS